MFENDLLDDLRGPNSRMIERLSIEDRRSRKMTKFNLFPRQKELCDVLEKEKYVVINKSRVVGATTTLAAFIATTLFKATPDEPETVSIICNTYAQSEEFLKKVRSFVVQLYQMFFSVLDKKDLFVKSGNREFVLFNGSRVMAKSSDPSCQCGVGGVTWIVMDESAFISQLEDVYASVLPTLVSGGRVTMISTPHENDYMHREVCRRALLEGTNKWNGFKLFEMKWYEDPRYNKNLKWFRAKDGIGEIIVEKCLDQDGNVAYDPACWENMLVMGYKPFSPWYASICAAYAYNNRRISAELDASFS